MSNFFFRRVNVPYRTEVRDVSVYLNKDDGLSKVSHNKGVSILNLGLPYRILDENSVKRPPLKRK